MAPPRIGRALTARLIGTVVAIACALGAGTVAAAALPAYGVATSDVSAGGGRTLDTLEFAATVWNPGPGPRLVVGAGRATAPSGCRRPRASTGSACPPGCRRPAPTAGSERGPPGADRPLSTIGPHGLANMIGLPLPDP